ALPPFSVPPGPDQLVRGRRARAAGVDTYVPRVDPGDRDLGGDAHAQVVGARAADRLDLRADGADAVRDPGRIALLAVRRVDAQGREAAFHEPRARLWILPAFHRPADIGHLDERRRRLAARDAAHARLVERMILAVAGPPPVDRAPRDRARDDLLLEHDIRVVVCADADRPHAGRGAELVEPVELMVRVADGGAQVVSAGRRILARRIDGRVDALALLVE